ncbi:Uncharacterised protein r2_g228 [Pycnogonum litorale]
MAAVKTNVTGKTYLLESSALTPLSNEVSEVSNVSSLSKVRYHGFRYFMAALCYISLVFNFFMKFNINIAIVDMVSSSATTDDDRKFNWNSRTQGVILSSFFWGYIVTQLPGGIIASRFGIKKSLIVSVFITTILAFITPVSTIHGGAKTLIFLRVIMGLCLGITVPSYIVFWSKWSPKLERAKLIALTYSGMYSGTFVALAFGGRIVQQFGWEAVFYACGFVGIIWMVLWFIFVSDLPEDNNFISSSEMEYIVHNRGDISSGFSIRNIPWRKLASSLSFISILMAYICDNWAMMTLASSVPVYMKRVYKFDIGETGIVSGLPYLAETLVLILFGYLSDYVIKNSYGSTKFVRKFCVCFGIICQAVCLVCLAFVTNSTFFIILFGCCASLSGVSMAGYKPNLLDIAPNAVGPMMGIACVFGSVSCILAPIINGQIVVDQSSVDQWKYIFFFSAGLNMICGTAFAILSSSEELEWNKFVALH